MMSNEPIGSHEEGRERLTEDGERRREEILAGLHRQLRHRTVRRRIVRGGGVAMVMAAAGIASVVVLRQNVPTETGTVVVEAQEPAEGPGERPKETGGLRVVESSPAGADVIVQIVSSESLPPLNCADPSPPATIRVCMLSDDQLIEELAAAGEPCGLMRAGGKTRLLCDDIGKDR